MGHLVGLIVHIASIQDRDGAVAVLASIRRLYPRLRLIFADGGYMPATSGGRWMALLVGWAYGMSSVPIVALVISVQVGSK